MIREVGTRVGAILGTADDGSLEFLGFGTYKGNLRPDKPIAMMAAIMGKECDTWEKVAKHYQEEMNLGDKSVDEILEMLPTNNPCIELDGGAIVWGAECWWGDEASVQKRLDAAEKVVEVDPCTVEGLQAYNGAQQ